jgi:glutathione S-transferase
MKLYGSQTSPYVRRIRLLLAQAPHDFINLNIFADADRQTLAAINPTLRIPMLEDDEKIIFDSGVIYRYLAPKLGIANLNWYQENQLTLINAVNDSLVMLLQCSRSGFDTSDDKLFFNLQRERVATSLYVLELQAANGEFAGWDYLAMSLYSLVDWTLFRQLLELTDYPALLEFVTSNAGQAGIADSDPRLG